MLTLQELKEIQVLSCALLDFRCTSSLTLRLQGEDALTALVSGSGLDLSTIMPPGKTDVGSVKAALAAGGLGSLASSL